MSAFFLAFLLLALVLGGIIPMAMRDSILPQPLASEHGKYIDDQIRLTFWIVGIIFSLAQLALAYLVIKYRSRGQKATYVEGHTKFEVSMAALAGILFVSLNLMGQHIWAGYHLKKPDENTIKIECTGMQFEWHFRYPGKDGVFGNLDNRLIGVESGDLAKALEKEEKDKAAGKLYKTDRAKNLVGVEWKSGTPGADDIHTSDLIIPVDREIELQVRGQDVIHSVFVRELRVKQDAVPGLRVNVHFKAINVPQKLPEKLSPPQHIDAQDVVNYFELACAELCGSNHYAMKSHVWVLKQDAYDRWLKAMNDDVVKAAEDRDK